MSIEGYARTSTTWSVGDQGSQVVEFHDIGTLGSVEVSAPDDTYASTWTTHTVPGYFLNWDALAETERRPAACDPQPPVDPTDDLCSRISELVNESLEEGWFEQK